MGLVCFLIHITGFLLSRLTAFQGQEKKDIQEKMCAISDSYAV
ncbi:hypothetical protein ECAA86_04623 [Escherichia coli AA86]|uniref:Uncharacterized protein n=1 Tax=Escherichia coli M605 TaxID=656417 RepID=F4T827_ECOLX|nr:Uncharacterized protein YtfM precursor [Escherichia coli]EDV68449.1 hypothetical protein EcF11_0829 [Escherichia coli F11]EGH37088.1 hypothetical protein ECAA86_04623 [Escherichia coli AA86]EGI12905.1 conserved hypothetical protein [Escherichia coli M605]KDZ53245.1 hypothetical protein AB16_1203 [Escherichia coli 3-073-06_S1_C1]KEJ53600.1 hypothetical protein AC85_5312 [Escherichia coli 3-020-07_S4_C1]OSK72264.1 hypothetical protein EAAG_03903 [Escherichia coli H001]